MVGRTVGRSAGRPSNAPANPGAGQPTNTCKPTGTADRPTADRPTNKQKQTNKQTNKLTNKRTNEQTNKHTDNPERPVYVTLSLITPRGSMPSVLRRCSAKRVQSVAAPCVLLDVPKSRCP